MSTIIRRFLSSPAVLTVRALAAVAVIASTAHANPAITFTLTHGSAESSPDYDWVKFGGGQFLAWSNEDATISFSSDGQNWQHYPTGQGDDVAVTDAIYGNGVWMTLWDEHWMRLGDNQHWTLPDGFSLTDVAFGNGFWLALGDDGGVWRSFNAIDWTRVADTITLVRRGRLWFPHNHTHYSYVYESLSFAGENFVVGAVMHSTDGIEWTPTDDFPAAPPDAFGDIDLFAQEYYGSPGGPYVAHSAISAGGEWRLMTQSNLSWPFSSTAEQRVAFGEEIAALIQQRQSALHQGTSQSGHLIVSDDRSVHKWAASGVNFQAVACSDNQAVAVDETGLIVSFADGQWRESRLRSPAELRGIAYGNGLWVAVGESGVVAVSDSGIADWKVLGVLRKAGFYDGRFLALGDEAALISDDGLEWSNVTPPPLETIGEMRIDGGFVVYDATGSQSAYSSDGTSWTVQDKGLSQEQISIPNLPVSITTARESITLQTDQGVTEPFRDLREFFDLAVGNRSVALIGRWKQSAAGYLAAFLAFDSTGGYAIANNQGGIFPVEYFERGGNLFAVAYGAGRFVVVGDGAITFWTESFADYGTTEFLAPEEAWSTDEEHPNLFDVAYGNGRFVAVGAGNTIYTSELTVAEHPTRGEVWAAGGGWYQHQKYGWFYPMENGWDWHLSLGWVLPNTGSADFWIWLENIGWAWSDTDKLPWVYLSNQQQWWTVDLYSTVPNLVFWRYDEGSQQWTWTTQGEF